MAKTTPLLSLLMLLLWKTRVSFTSQWSKTQGQRSHVVNLEAVVERCQGSLVQLLSPVLLMSDGW